MDKILLEQNLYLISTKLQKVGASMIDNVVAISKKKEVSAIQYCYQQSLRKFGENYVQELVEKQKILQEICPDIEWHFTGHLQTNKVKYIAPFIHTIQTVDSVKLAKEISKEALKNHRIISIFIQVNTSGESSKSGVSPSEVVTLVREIMNFSGISIDGLMTIPAILEENEELLRKEFQQLVEIKNTIELQLSLHLSHLSMGMTNDYIIALEEKATLVRIGTGIFGERS
ncbi:MAG: YggS family pyridoxal phosphate-dependent enzyme [Candidatus Kapabacteria bacterium]|nr:YggS family pyridoxal phosphate-dependent enzyme [Candidatus Kapabacteria bacterium]